MAALDLLEIALARAAEALDALPQGAPNAVVMEAIAPLRAHLLALGRGRGTPEGKREAGEELHFLVAHPTFLEVVRRHGARVGAVIDAAKSQRDSLDRGNHI